MISDRYKLFLFKQLYKELSNVKIIPYEGDILFIDVDSKYWYFEYDEYGMLWWRYEFFESFFSIFSLKSHEYESIIEEWVEDVLNYKILANNFFLTPSDFQVDEVLSSNISNVKKVSDVLESFVEKYHII